MGTLYIVPTPIGNLEDITLRAINTLKEVDLICAEDTRESKILLKHYEINTKVISFHDHNEEDKSKYILEQLKEGKSIALISDRGTPLISDPGFKLINLLIENDIKIESLPGATALIPAVTLSGLNPRFTFLGFLNRKANIAKEELASLKYINASIVIYESPHRLTKTLELIEEVLGNRKVMIARELTKKFETVYHGLINEEIKETKDIKGEIVIVVDGYHETEVINDDIIKAEVNKLIANNISKNNAIKQVANAYKLKRNDVYKLIHESE